jgi:hypothetical protein
LRVQIRADYLPAETKRIETMANIDGKWDVTVNSPMGQQKITVVANANGDELTGTLEGSMGSTAFSNGKVDGDNFSFEATITEPFAIGITVSGDVTGDEMKGQVKTQGFGSFPMKGVRV